MAGIPNITGALKWHAAYGNASVVGSATGAFTQAKQTTSSVGLFGESRSWSPYYPEFSAKDSNAIYGKSKTVTPLSRKCLFLIKY